MDAASNNSVDDVRDLRERVALRARLRQAQGLHPRRGAHAHAAGVERVPQDARGAAAEHGLRAGDHRGEQDPPDGRRPLPPLRLHAADGRADRARAAARRRVRSRSRSPPTRWRCVARHATGSFRDALGTLEQLVTYSGRTIALDDVLAVLGIADADLLFECLDAVAAARPAPRAAGRRAADASPAATPRAFLRDLEAHARDLMVVGTLGVGAGRARDDARPRRPAGRAGRRGCRAATSSACSS